MSRSVLMIFGLWAAWAPPPLGWCAWPLVLPWALRGPRARWPAAVGLALLCAGAGWPDPGAADVAPGAVALEGVIRRPPTARSVWLDVAGRRVELSGDAPLPEAGRRVRITARVGATGRVMVVTCSTLGDDVSPRALVDRVAAACRRRLRAVVARPQRGLVEALVLGERRDLPHPVRLAASDSGTAHLLALSGLHVALVAAWLARVVPALGLPPRLGTALVLVAFVAIAGARPPLVRAAATWAVGAAAVAWGRRSCALDRLGLAALVLATWAPDVRDDLGARLSFCAVAGLVATARALPRRVSALAPVGAFVATAPLCVETFGRVQPLGVAWSWVLGPLVALVMALGLVAVLLPSSPIDAWLSSALSASAGWLEAGFEFAARHSPPPAQPAPPALGGWVTSLLVVATLVALAPRRHAGWEELS